MEKGTGYFSIFSLFFKTLLSDGVNIEKFYLYVNYFSPQDLLRLLFMIRYACVFRGHVAIPAGFRNVSPIMAVSHSSALKTLVAFPSPDDVPGQVFHVSVDT
jgi:hypothetical protein